MSRRYEKVPTVPVIANALTESRYVGQGMGADGVIPQDLGEIELKESSMTQV